ncbi:MAG: SH3 domain-containing protein [Flavobacteriaceae bacterium]|tara:strand:- start:76 stop:951 length:876 start_codon:yes stop_codon:yes gene_type:complete
MKKLLLVLLLVPLVSFGQSIENNSSSTFLEKYNNTVWTDGISTIRFRKLSSIKYTESTKEIKGYVFDGFLKKSVGNGKLYDDKGYFIIQDYFENLKNIYDINAKSGLNVRESPSTSGKIVDKLEYGITVKILKKTGEFFEVEGIKGEWVEIKTYNQYGHRQHLFPDNDGRNFFVNEVNESDTLLECEMCGYKKITQNIGNILTVLDNVRNDFGDIESSENSFLINNNELIHTLEQGNPAGKVLIKERFIPLSSDSIYIEEVKKENKIKQELFTYKWKRLLIEYENTVLDDY